jgi:Ca2+-binding EF-hand superfamily protein
MRKIAQWVLGMALVLPAGVALAWNCPLTDEEFAAARAAAFEEADANDDGSLMVEEFQTLLELRRQRHREVMFGRLDANEDGVVSLEELEEGKGKLGRRGRGRGHGRGPRW